MKTTYRALNLNNWDFEGTATEILGSETESFEQAVADMKSAKGATLPFVVRIERLQGEEEGIEIRTVVAEGNSENQEYSWFMDLKETYLFGEKM